LESSGQRSGDTEAHLGIRETNYGPGALDALTKELIYIAVSVTNQCPYCIASHTASAQDKGMSSEMFHELMAVVGMANETNRLVAGYQVEIDEEFKRA
jgi:AhpD family alkylhydroperoxidase